MLRKYFTLTLICAINLMSYAQPVVDFIASETETCAQNSISFTNNTTGCIGNALYYWDFGNGQTSIEENPECIYEDIGLFTVSLTVTCDGFETSISNNISVLTSPIINSLSADSNCATPLDYVICTNIENADNWDWSFYTINGTEITIIESESVSTEDCYPITLPTEQTYWCKVTANNNSTGCITSDSIELVIQAPHAIFSLSENYICTNESIILNGSESINSTMYLWDFGDGTNSGWITESTVMHFFGEGDVFVITLTIRDENGCEDSMSQQLNTIVPEISILIDEPFGYSPHEVIFTDNSTAEESIMLHVWDFGDGNNASGSVVSNTYESPGVYSVTINVGTISGCENEMFFEDTITVVAEPEIQITVTPASGQDIADGAVNVTVIGGVEPIEITCNSAKTEHDFTELLPGNYTINVEDANGHTASEEFTLGWVSNINDFYVENKIKVFSTLSEGTLIVQTPYIIPSSIKMINTTSQILFETIPNSERTVINISGFKDGLYFIKCDFGNNVITNKIFITNR